MFCLRAILPPNIDQMSDKRKHERLPLSAKVKITHPDIGSVMVWTRDVSDGGVFLITNDTKLPPIGSVVEGQVQGSMENAPIIKMEIVRVDCNGVGVKFCN